ncbi:hypothetical protein HOK51_08770 [Candidatus Woesearchaeota archaeon]|jgi:hypothetical protein|nr:hypothetical protein [Candidatus Woesearchaeota archaeon]MBT6519920.1 hypothetical protein [Candidatus Woesearchaeota archaeon]MBT7367104.1 hypothetical protein [Candidatus Woesearchaeota archaeon]
MNKQEKSILLKGISIVFIVIVVVDFILFFLFRIPPLVFWIVIILSALVAYYGIPFLRKTFELE